MKMQPRKVEQAVEVLAREFGASEIWLLGSAARGATTEDSDIDLLVVRPARADSPRPSVEARLCLSRHGIHHRFDLLVLTPERWRQVQERPVGVYDLAGPGLAGEALQHGLKLYEG
jgi:predicted nucleotidyltransferase